MPRKINPLSKYNRKMDRIGEFPNEKSSWNNETDDILLECWLVQELSFISPNKKRPTLKSILGRKWKSIQNRIWKLSTNYGEAAGYEAINRSERSGSFTKRDLEIVVKATDKEGHERNADDPKYLAKILGRNEHEVFRLLEDIKNNGIPKPQEDPEKIHLEKIIKNQMIHGKKMKELGIYGM